MRALAFEIIHYKKAKIAVDFRPLFLLEPSQTIQVCFQFL